MLPLRDFTPDQIGQSTQMESVEWYEFVLIGWYSFLANWVYNLFTLASRKQRLEAIHREVLPEYPNSVICPRCMHVIPQR